MGALTSPEVGKYLKSRLDKQDFRSRAGKMLTKIRRQVTRDYVLKVDALPGPPG